MGPINNKPAVVQIVAWRRTGDTPLSDLSLFSLLFRLLFYVITSTGASIATIYVWLDLKITHAYLGPFCWYGFT